MEQLSLFDVQAQEGAFDVATPLAERMRPQALEDYVGQRHLLGKGMLLRQMLEKDRISSMIFWGPPEIGRASCRERV